MKLGKALFRFIWFGIGATVKMFWIW